MVKIGTSRAFSRRLGALQTAAPATLALVTSMPGGPAIEGAVHRLFAADRVRGEWFTETPALTDFMARVVVVGQSALHEEQSRRGIVPTQNARQRPIARRRAPIAGELYSPTDVRRIAGRSLADERTIKKWARGEEVRPIVARAILMAAKHLGLRVPPKREPEPPPTP